MSPTAGYCFAKVLGKLRRDKHKETLSRWFMKRGVKLVGYPEALKSSPESLGGGLNHGQIYAAI